MDRFERIGLQIMNRAGGGPMGGTSRRRPRRRAKRRTAAQILGQAFVTAVACMRHNREAVAQVAEVLVQRGELHGDEVVELLEQVGPRGAGDRRPRRRMADVAAACEPDDRCAPGRTPGPAPRTRPGRGRSTTPPRSSPRSRRRGRGRPRSSTATPSSSARARHPGTATCCPSRAARPGSGRSTPAGGRVPPPHASRFNFLYGALAALAIAAVAAAVVALTGGGRHEDGSLVSWSAWRPTQGPWAAPARSPTTSSGATASPGASSCRCRPRAWTSRASR